MPLVVHAMRFTSWKLYDILLVWLIGQADYISFQDIEGRLVMRCEPELAP